MVRTQYVIVCSALLFAAAACGGKKKASGPPVPPPTLNTPPTITAPSGLTGSAPNYLLTLPIADTRSLTFTAADENGDSLLWQLGVDGAAAAAAGLTFTTPLAGSTFAIEVGAATTPAAVLMTLLVEDTKGGIAAVDLRLVRSGPPTITSVSPSSAFFGKPQPARITGTALQLGGAALTTVAFGGLAAGNTTIVSDLEATCTTPGAVPVGPAVVAVANQFGNSQLPSSAFTVRAFPPALSPADARLDAGDASQVHLVRDGATLHGVWLETAAAVHSVSLDGGATWSPGQTLSGGEAASAPRILINGNEVMVAWIGDGTSVWLRRSTDGGTNFELAQRLDAVAPVQPASRVRLASAGLRRHAAWVAGDATLGNARIQAVVSTDAGLSWTAPSPVSSGNNNQLNHDLGCDGNVVWVLCEDDRSPGPRGAYFSRSTDGGGTWAAATRLSPLGVAANGVRLASSGSRLFATWIEAGGMFVTTSADRGAAFSSSVLQLQTGLMTTISSPHLACTEDRAIAAYIVGGNTVRVATFDIVGATIQQTTIDSVTTTSAAPVVTFNGNYVFVAWREGDLGGGTARIQYSVSTNSGGAFAAPTGLGDGTADQDLPQLIVDGANLFLGWIDGRDATSALYVNRTIQ